MRRAGFIATLAAGVGLLGASLHGFTSVDQTLKIAAATPTSQPELVRESGGFDCHKRDHHRDGPEV